MGRRMHTALPEELVAFLLEFGFGDINDELSFRRDWVTRVESGPLTGHVVFGQDELGNFYTVDPSSKAVHCMSRSEPGYCYLASSFNKFMREVAIHGFKVMEWVEAQPLLPHAGAA